MEYVDLVTPDNSQDAYVDLVTPENSQDSSAASLSGECYVRSVLRTTNDGDYQLTKNLRVRHLHVTTSLPKIFPVHPDGIATFLSVSKEGPLAIVAVPGLTSAALEERLGSCVPYSGTMRSDRKSSVQLAGISYRVERVVVECTGVKSCSCSMKKNSIPHHGIQENSTPMLSVPSFPTHPDEVDMKKARDLFFFAQAHFPAVCSHSSIVLQTEGLKKDKLSKQFRAPNWQYVPGYVRNSSSAASSSTWVPPIIMPDFIGCAQFGSLGVQERKNCTVVVVPEDLRGVKKRLLDGLISAAHRGNFPCQPESAVDKCPVLETSSQRKFCPNSAVHGHELVQLSVIPCSARYQYLIHKSDEGVDWAVVIGYGVHNHSLPFQHPSPAQVERVVEQSLRINPRTQVRHLMHTLVSTFGSRPSTAAVQKRKYNYFQRQNLFGRHLDGLIRLHRSIGEISTNNYVWSIHDQRLEDERRPTSEQVGIVICMGHEQLLKRSVSAPNYACDGTFNMVSQSGDLLKYELVSIICKDPLTGRMYSPFRAITSRKTTAARKLLFRSFLIALKSAGLQDPLTAAPTSILTIATDFETTFALCIGDILAEIFRPYADMTETRLRYIENVCFGCGVHAKRIIMEKVDILKEVRLYHWLVGTRTLDTEDDVQDALRQMATVNIKLGHFARWLRRNFVAKILWFWKLYKTTTPGVYRRILWTTNISEVEHSVLKGSSDYLLTRCKGLDLVSLTKFLHAHDDSEHKNLTGQLGVPLVSTPLHVRTPRKRKRAAEDAYIVVDGESVHASQPKQAKRTM